MPVIKAPTCFLGGLCLTLVFIFKTKFFLNVFVKQIPLDHHVCFSQVCFPPLRRSLHKHGHQIALLFGESLKNTSWRIFKRILWVDPSWHEWCPSSASKHYCPVFGWLRPWHWSNSTTECACPTLLLTEHVLLIIILHHLSWVFFSLSTGFSLH